MLYEILDETLSKLEEYEKQNPDEIKFKQVSFNSLKSQIIFFRNLWARQISSQPEELKKNTSEVV